MTPNQLASEIAFTGKRKRQWLHDPAVFLRAVARGLILALVVAALVLILRV